MVGTKLCCDFFSPPFFPQSFTLYKMHEFYLPQKKLSDWAIYHLKQLAI